MTRTGARPGRTGVALLDVDGSPAARAGAHLMTVGALTGLAVAPFFDGVAVAVFALVLGGITLARVLGLPTHLQTALGLALQGGAWASVFHLYAQIWWIDLVAHLVLTGLLAAAAGIVLHRARMTPAGTDTPGRRGIALTTTTVGISLAVVWELLEWFGHAVIDDTIHIAPADTMGDLAAGGLGAWVAGILLARRLQCASAS